MGSVVASLCWEKIYLSSLATVLLKYLQNKATFHSPQSLRIINTLLFSPFVSDRCSTFVKAATAESPIRGLKPPRGLTFGSVIGATSCQVLPCVQKSLAAPWRVTLGL